MAKNVFIILMTVMSLSSFSQEIKKEENTNQDTGVIYTDSLLADIINNFRQIHEERLMINDEVKSINEENRNNTKSILMLNLYHDYDMQKAWLQRIIESPEYFRRLIIEYCTERAANIERRERIENLSKDYIIEHYEKIEKRLDNVAGYSNWITHLPNYYETCIGVHEFAHQSTNHGIYLSTYAKNLYKLAFDSSKVDGKIIVAIGKTDREYYGDPKELDAMKKELEFELERLEIKKYEETFTHEHYVQIMQLINQGLFTSYRIKVFLKVIRPEFMEQIMNTIT